jgi:hypothetical protein
LLASALLPAAAQGSWRLCLLLLVRLMRLRTLLRLCGCSWRLHMRARLLHGWRC